MNLWAGKEVWMDIEHFKRLLILKPEDKTGEVLEMEIMWVAQNTLNLILNRERAGQILCLQFNT